MIQISNRFWVGSTDTWNSTAGSKWATTSGGAGGAAVPTAADDVFFDANSTGTITTSGTTTDVCRSLNCTGFTGTITHAAATTIVIGDGTAGASNVALTLVAGMTYTLGSTTTSALSFVSTSGTQQTVTFGGKTTGSMTFSGAGGSWQFQDNLTATAIAITHSAGTLDFNGKTISISSYPGSSSTTRTLTMGAASITINRTAGTAWDMVTNTNLTVTANTATITFAQATTMNIANTNMNGASIVSAATSFSILHTGATVANVTRTGTSAKTDFQTFSSGQTLTITGTLTLNGNSTTSRLLVQGNTVGTAATVSAATVSMSNVDFVDITGAGAGTWSGTSIGNALGNSGITFTTPVTRYGVVAGNWSSTATWSTTSGGAGGSSVPLCHDTVYLDGSSAAGTYTGDMPRLGAGIDFTGFTRTYTSTITTTMYGSLTLASGMTYTLSGALTLAGRSTLTLTSATKTFASGLTISAPSGTYTLQDAITLSSGITLTVTAGTFATGNNAISTGLFGSAGSLTRAITLGSSTVSLTATTASTVWNIASASGLTLSAASSTIAITATSSSTRTFAGAGLTYGTLTYTVAGSTGQLAITGSNTFGTINFSDVTNARTLAFPAGTTTTYGTFNVNGTSGKLMTINSATASTAATLTKNTAGYASCDYLSVQDITHNQPLTFYVGANSTNTSGNSNVIFTVPDTLYRNRGGNTSATGTSLTATFADGGTATSGNLLVAAFTAIGSTSTFTPPSGWTQAVTVTNTAVLYIWYKISAGTETNVACSWVTSRQSTLHLWEFAGFAGTPTLDVSETNSNVSTATSLATNAGAGVTNTAQPAIVVAAVGGNGTLGATAGWTNSFLEELGYASNPMQIAVKVLTSTAAITTTHTWTTTRVPSSGLAAFIGVGGVSFVPMVVMVD